jgi:hypothetical protein
MFWPLYHPRSQNEPAVHNKQEDWIITDPSLHLAKWLREYRFQLVLSGWSVRILVGSRDNRARVCRDFCQSLDLNIGLQSYTQWSGQFRANYSPVFPTALIITVHDNYYYHYLLLGSLQHCLFKEFFFSSNCFCMFYTTEFPLGGPDFLVIRTTPSPFSPHKRENNVHTHTHTHTHV